MHTHKCLNHIAITMKTICILLVILFLVGVLQIIATEIYLEFSREHQTVNEKPPVEMTNAEIKQLQIHNSQKEFAPDGTLYLVNDNIVTPGKFNKKKMIVKSKDNTILYEGDKQNCPYTFIQWYPQKNSRHGYYQNINQRHLDEFNLISGEFSRHFVIPTVNEQNQRIGHWFFDVDKRIFIYYSIDGRQDGCLGTNGYTENKSDALAFGTCQRMTNWLRPDSYDPMMLYQTEYAVYQIDFNSKQVKTLAKTDNDPIRYVILNNWQENEVYDYRPSLTIITNSKKCYLYLKEPEQLIQTQLPDDFPAYYGTPTFAANENTIFVRCQEMLGYPKTDNWNTISAWWQENRYKPRDYKIRLFEVDSDGSFTTKNSFTWTQPAEPRRTFDYAGNKRLITYTANSLSSPVPVWVTGHWFKNRAYRQWPVWSSITMEFIRAYSSIKTPVNLAVMAVFAALAFLHGWCRRTHIAKLAFWVVFVFLFNLPGLLTYLALNHTPVIRCVHCGQKRGLLQNTCCRCQTALPLPKAKETDLVMPLSV